MNLIIHRGTQEIGGTCIELIAADGTRIIFDVGMQLEEPADGAEDPAVAGLYSTDVSNAPNAVLISHPHLDHYGLLDEIKNSVAVYAGAATWKLMDTTRRVFSKPNYNVCRHCFAHAEAFVIGSFRITPYLMDHSAFDSYAFVIEADGKTIIYSGDFREHGRKGKLLDMFLAKAPKHADVLLMEGTCLTEGLYERKSWSEQMLESKIVESVILGKPYFFYSSSQNIDRLVTFYRTALKTGRELVIDAYTANILEDLAVGNKLPKPSVYDKIRVHFYGRSTDRLIVNDDKSPLNKFRPKKIQIPEIAQRLGELVLQVRPGMIALLSNHCQIDGGVLAYSLWSGYKDKPDSQRLMKWATDRNMAVLDLHTSGHAGRDTLKKMAVGLEPKVIIPIHTLAPGEYGEFGNVRLVGDGEVVTI
ncbi:MAG: MBL fold metallo-hydrolase [Bacillota bacterium]